MTQEQIVNMNWLHVTERLAREFHLLGSFVLDPVASEWVGVQPPLAFREYLSKLLVTKEPSYFNEIRFYKYNREGAKDHSGKEAVSYLALMPMKLKNVSYQFLGLLYESPEQLQELLRMRIMPNYTLFWVYQLVTEARVRNANDTGQKALLKALDEQRIYASRLESKVATLHEQIEGVRNAELTLDQRVVRLGDLLDGQMNEYAALSDNYQKLYHHHEELQEDFLTTCVRLETRLAEMEGRAVVHEIMVEDNPENESQEDQNQPKSSRRVKVLMERIKDNNEKLLELRHEYLSLKKEYGGVSPGHVRQLMEHLEELKTRCAYYKDRAEEQEQRLKQFKAEAQAARRGTRKEDES